ncbi:MAG: hypothetical protein M1833_006247 [Piccolia ochrophora]|nr:MAG: hypothetical protein M1833_006247 [Piccolia ochrophora]
MFTPRQVKRKITDSPNPHPQNQGSHIRFAQDDNPPKRTRSNASTPHALTPITTPQTSSSTKQQELVLGLELILSDYSYHNPEASLWLKDRERTLNGEAGYIHFSSLLTHSVFARTKPIPTQPALKEALLEYPSSHLEVPIHPASTE